MHSLRNRLASSDEDLIMKMKYVPNIISCFRILATIALFFAKAFTGPFFVIYALAGISDVLDGWIARSTNNTTDAGAKLDSAADLLYYIIMAVKIFPVLMERLSVLTWCVIGLIVALRIFSYCYIAIKYGRFASLHTYMNKLTGAVVFLMPFLVRTRYLGVYSVAGCAIALLAAVEELVIDINFRSSYDSNVKTIFSGKHVQKKTV